LPTHPMAKAFEPLMRIQILGCVTHKPHARMFALLKSNFRVSVEQKFDVVDGVEKEWR
jgi:hypothetical protein